MLDNGVDMTFVIFLSSEELEKKNILFKSKSEDFILLHNI